MMEQHECLDKIMKRWEEPFEIPIMISRETMDIQASTYTVKVYNLTSSGRISKKGKGHLLLNFCPMCGEQLREIKKASDD